MACIPLEESGSLQAPSFSYGVPDLRWRQLVIKYQVSGVQVHDTRLVAAMLEHGIAHLLTFNTDDFKRFSEINVVHPSALSIA